MYVTVDRVWAVPVTRRWTSADHLAGPQGDGWCNLGQTEGSSGTGLGTSVHRDISDLPIAVQLPWLSEGCYVLAGPGATASSTPFIHVFLPLPKTSRGCQWSVHAWARACARTHTHTQWKRESFVPVCSTRTSLPFPHISGRLETQYRKAYCFLSQRFSFRATGNSDRWAFCS